MLKDREALAHVQAKAGGQWFRITDQADQADETVIDIFDEIGYWGTTADAFVEALNKIDTAKIRVRINSPGGEVFAGIAIYNALRAHPATVTTEVYGIAASIASVIAQAGDHRIMLQHSQMMVHRASGLAWGNGQDMREFADILDVQDGLIASIYAVASGDPDTAEKMAELMDAETWMVDQEAVDVGLADEMVVPKSAPGEDPPNVVEPDKVDPEEEVEGALDPDLTLLDKDTATVPVDQDWSGVITEADNMEDLFV